ncbi:hypothetical protein E2P64_06050 [Candidatus Bathyarchaeota archaeon]|nr:hypothetical protein E2P64_06050 [Candidatus Bathyarchaeota archaeon]
MKTSLLKALIRECVQELLFEGVTTHLSNLDIAKKVASKIWGDQFYRVDIHRVDDAFYEFSVKLGGPGGPTEMLRQYKNNHWFFWNDQRKKWVNALLQ